MGIKKISGQIKKAFQPAMYSLILNLIRMILRRDYVSLLPWWALRSSTVDDYRRNGAQAGVLSVRLDYPKVLEAAKIESKITVFCDLQAGINKWIGDGALIYAGSKLQLIYH